MHTHMCVYCPSCSSIMEVQTGPYLVSIFMAGIGAYSHVCTVQVVVQTGPYLVSIFMSGIGIFSSYNEYEM